MNRKITAALTILILVLAAAIVAAPQNARLVDTSTGQVVTNSNLFVESSDNVVNAVVAVETARIDGEDATAGDTAGSDLLIAAGQGTGSADSGDIEFEVAITDEGTSTTLKTREAVARFEGLTGWLSLLKPLEMLEEASTPSNPSTDSWLLYFQDDGLYYLEDDGTEVGPLSAGGGVTDHGALTGLSDDDHTQYALLAGRSTGQTIIGGTGASENLTLSPTSNATKGHVIIEGGQFSSADATFTGTQVMGLNAVASGNDGVVIGNGANVGPNGVVIGQGAAGGDGAVVIGQGSGGGGFQGAVIIGSAATGTDNAIALGLNADASGGNVAVGSGTTADGVGSIAIGGGADAGHDGSIAIGSSDIATTTAANQLVIKGITTAYLGDGVTDTSPNAVAVYATGGSGANVNGADFTVAAGAGTGDAAGGRFYIDYAPAGATGSSANSYAQAFEIEGDGDARIYNDLQVDGDVSVPSGTVNLQGSTPLRILENGGSAFAQFSILSSTDLRIIGGAGLTDFNVASLDTSVASLSSGAAITATTGDITATAGDIVATAGDVLVTAGGVGIGSGAPSAKLHVDDGGTTPTIAAATQVIIQDTTASNSSAALSIIAGAGTNGFSAINLGDSVDENSAIIRSDNGNDTIQMRAGGSGIDFTMDASGNITTTGTSIVQNSPSPVGWYVGSGSPEGVLTARVGSIYSRTDGGAGTSLYVKESGTGSSGWVGK